MSNIIHRYTRAQAIADGRLVDVTTTARGAGFRHPVAITAPVWADTIAWADGDNTRKDTVQDEAGRLWDVVWMAATTARRMPPGVSAAQFKMLRVPRGGPSVIPQPVWLEVVVGPGDTHEPVITIQFPGQD